MVMLEKKAMPMSLRTLLELTMLQFKLPEFST